MRGTGTTAPAGDRRTEDSTALDAAPRFRMLGPLEAVAAGRPVHLGGTRQRTILAMLLIHAGRVVSVDRLAEAVWDEQQPASARTQISIVVSALRRAFAEAGVGEPAIVTAPPGYVLRVDPGHTDTDAVAERVALAQAAAAGGRHEEAVALLRAAAGTWRGQPFADVPSTLVQAAAARLDERRLMLVEEYLQLELALGRAQEQIAEIGAHVERHPFRERLRGQLMVALYRTGRCAEALEVYRDFQRVLAAELGLDPSWELRELHQAMLRGAPLPAAAPYVAELSAPSARASSAAPAGPSHPPVPVELPSDDPLFAGRDGELAVLDRLLAQRTGGPAVVNVAGMGGIGKTSLAVHWAHHVAERFPDGQIFVSLAGHDERRRPLTPSAALERVLRALAVPAKSVPEDVEERSALLRTTLRGRRILLVLDDARSAAQVRPLLPGSDGCCVLVTSRAHLHDLAVREGVHLLVLDPLSVDAAAGLLRAALGPARVAGQATAVSQLAEHCGGLPLALRIAAARLRARPYWTVADLVARTADESRRLDELAHGGASVRDAFAASYRTVPARAACLLRRAAALDVEDFAPWLGASLLGTGLDHTEDLLGALLEAHLVRFDGTDAAGQPRFRLPGLARLYAQERTELEEPDAALGDALEAALGACRYLVREAYARAAGGRRRERPRRVCPPFDAATVDRIVTRPRSWLRCERATLPSLAQSALRTTGRPGIAALARGA